MSPFSKTSFITLLAATAFQITGCGGGDSAADISQNTTIASKATHIQLVVRDGLNANPAERTKTYRRAISELSPQALDILDHLEPTTNGLYCMEDGVQFELAITTTEHTQKYSSNNSWCNNPSGDHQYIALGSLLDLELALK